MGICCEKDLPVKNFTEDKSSQPLYSTEGFDGEKYPLILHGLNQNIISHSRVFSNRVETR